MHAAGDWSAYHGHGHNLSPNCGADGEQMAPRGLVVAVVRLDEGVRLALRHWNKL